MGKSYTVIDFETRTNQFAERTMVYAQRDNLIELSDFSSERLVEIYGGDESTTQTFSANVKIRILNQTEETFVSDGYYAKDTYANQINVVNLDNAYVGKTAIRYAYLDDIEQNVEIRFSYVYKK